MKNDDLKKKIAQIIAKHLCLNKKSHFFLYGDSADCYNRDNFAECTPICDTVDALIAAGIGDVKAAEHRAEVAEKALRIMAKETPCDGWCPFSQKCNVDLNEENGYQCCFNEYLRQAEKELSEEKE